MTTPTDRRDRRPSVLHDYIVDDAGCWLWQGRVDANGYGKAYDPTEPPGRRVDWAHRVSYRAHVGEIPSGLHIDHLCCTRQCINPAHLEAVTRGENMRRAVERSGGLERQRRAVELHLEGLTYGQIAQALGLGSRSAAADMVNRAVGAGLVAPDLIKRRRAISEADRETIRGLYASGALQREIAERFGIDSSHVSRICSGYTSGHTAERARRVGARIK